MDDYPEPEPASPSTGGEDSAKSLAKRIAEIHPRFEVTARIDSYGGPMNDRSYLHERHARIKKEVAAGEDEIKNWDAEAVAAQALKSLKAEVAKLRADLMSCEAEMDAAGMSYGKAEAADEEGDDDEADAVDDDDAEDGKVIAKGNPYSVVRRGGKVVVENTETGHVKGRHSSKKKAMRQFRLLEGIEHGWKPTGEAAKS